MAVSIADVMSECKNHFHDTRQYQDYQTSRFLFSEYTISSGVITPHDDLTVGMYIAITGSKFNNGVYLVGDGYALTGTTDETFDGLVWYLYPPKEFITLCGTISTWDDAHAPETVVSESFGGYSRTNLTTKAGTIAGWQEAFKAKLNRYRRLVKVVPL